MVRVFGCVVWASLLAMSGCAGGAGATPRDTQELRATVRGVYEAVERGDERAYRELVALAPGDAYSDALTTTMFESVRLHQAVERRGFDRATASDPGPGVPGGRSPAVSRPIATTTRPTPPPSLAAVDYRMNARAMIAAVEGWTFTVRGDRATIDALVGAAGAPTLKRAKGRWVLAPMPWDARRDTAMYRLTVEQERKLAKALATARQTVERGSATSIDDVNNVLRSLLTEPTTQRGMDP
ncbi:MAG: hypothetical protein WBD40_06755 [Tepidisphaeraceae bacterium]